MKKEKYITLFVVSPDCITDYSIAGSKILIGDTVVHENIEGTGFYELDPLIDGQEIKIVGNKTEVDIFGLA